MPHAHMGREGWQSHSRSRVRVPAVRGRSHRRADIQSVLKQRIRDSPMPHARVGLGGLVVPQQEQGEGASCL